MEKKHEHQWKQWGTNDSYETTFWAGRRRIGTIGVIFICEKCLEKKEVRV